MDDQFHEKVLERKKFFEITQRAYILGLVGHGGAIFLFWYIVVLELVYFNVLFSVPAFAAALFLNKKGWANMAFFLAFIELLIHQVLTTYYLGWNSGAHFWLVYLAGLCFFNANWSHRVQLSLLLVVCSSYLILYTNFPEGVFYSIDDELLDVFNISNATTTIIVISLLINYYAKVTIRSERELLEEQNRTTKMLVKIESLFGQQISEKIAEKLINSEDEIEAATFEATIMFLDIRDFTVFADSKNAKEVADFQNELFGELIDIVLKNNGTVLQLLGDGIMAVFGAPIKDVNHAQNAVNASYEMLEKNNELGSRGTIPKVRLGIGLNSGSILAGNIGNERRKAYSLTGKNVIVAARIESLNKQFKSQFLISKSTYDLASTNELKATSLGEVELKGIEMPVDIYKLL